MADPTNGSNLMQYRNGTTITPAQSSRIRSQALLHIPDRMVDPVTPPLANAGVDALGDISAEEAFIDLNYFGVAVDQNAGTTTFFSSTAGLFPKNISDISYIFLADLDNNPSTGGSPADIGISTTASGIELIGRVQVDVIHGSPLATPTVLIFQSGQFIAVNDPGIQSKVLTNTIGLYQIGPPLLPDEEPISQNIQLEVPSSLVPPMSMDITLHAMAENPNTGTMDNATAALTFEVPTFPGCEVSSAIVRSGDEVTVAVSGLPPGVTARVFLGPKLVATGHVNGSGNATIPFVISEDVAIGRRSITVVVEDTAITADCSVVVIAGLINEKVSFKPIKSTFKTTSDTSGCTLDDTTEDEFVGQFSFDARLRNTSNSSLTCLVVEVTELTNGNVLQNADGGPGGAGARLTVPEEGDYADGILAPEESVNVHFIICLKDEEDAFRFLVDVLGSVEGGETESSQVPKIKATNTEPSRIKFRKGSRIHGKGFFGRFRPKKYVLDTE